MCNINKLKAELNDAMENGDVNRADQIMNQITELEQLELQTDMPENFVERTALLAKKREGKKKKVPVNGRSRLLLAAALVLVIAFCLGTAVYAAGIFFAKDQVNETTSRALPFEADSPEFKAAIDYGNYLDKTYIADYYDPWEHPIYAGEEKAKEISQKYGLNYATEKNCLKSIDQVKAQLKKRGLDKMLTNGMYKGISAEIDELNNDKVNSAPADYMVECHNFVLDEGTMSLSGTWQNYEYDIHIMPNGVLPYMGLENSLSTFLESELLNAFAFTSEEGTEFNCIPGSDYNGNQSGCTVFTVTDQGGIAITLSKWTPETEKNTNEAIEKKYDKLAQKELGLSGKDELVTKVTAWKEIAQDANVQKYNQANKAKYLINDDSKLNALEEKYKTYTKKEKLLYDQYMEELNKNLPKVYLSKKEVTSFLNQLNFK